MGTLMNNQTDFFVDLLVDFSGKWNKTEWFWWVGSQRGFVLEIFK